VPSVTGFRVTFAASAVAAAIGTLVAAFVTRPRRRRAVGTAVAEPG
jgi:hypothetical protein